MADHLQTKKAVDDLVSAVYSLLDDESDDESDESSSLNIVACVKDESDESSSLDIVACVKEFFSMIPKDNNKKSMEHLQTFDLCNAPKALCLLYNSPIERNKEIAEESIRLFLYPNISCLPRVVQNQCALLVSRFSYLLAGSDGHLGPLYNSCRKTLGALLKSIGFVNRSRYFGNAMASDLIEVFFRHVSDVSLQLMIDYIPNDLPSSVSTCESDICEFALFSLHLRRAIEDYFKTKGQSLPMCLNGNFDKHPCYAKSIKEFYRIFDRLLCIMNLRLSGMQFDIRLAGIAYEFNHRWSYYLLVLKELNEISKLFQGAEEKLRYAMQTHKFGMDILVKFSKRSDDHLWLLRHKNVLDYKYRVHLMMMMFPEVKNEDDELQKVLIDRSQLFTESFEHIAHANPRSLRNGLFVEFKNEEATGDGVLREWIFLVCQALFDPDIFLFQACPYDRRRFFPNPANVDPMHLSYFRFCGQMIALALMHKIQVGITFDRMFFLQLAGEKISLEDVRYADPCLYKSCKDILEMDIDFIDSDAMGLTFVKEIEEFGVRKEVELCPGGSNIVVNSKNREEYVHLFIQHCFVKSISKKVAYFARGFGDILSKCRLRKMFFQSLELEDLDMMLGSDTPICVKDWKAHTDYDDYKETDDQICWFWKVVEGMTLEQQREILFFWISMKYLPPKGFSSLPSRLYIYRKSVSKVHLPSAHTCFYRLALPHYPSLAVMEQHLFRICQEHTSSSFGI